jgi:glycosyltransferase involved in cell wall biosynthesis
MINRDEAGPPALRRYSVDPLPEERARPGAPTIVHLVPEHYPHVRQLIDGPLISHTVWETDGLPRQWPDLLNRFADRVIVPSAWNREVFEQQGVTKPVVVVPHVVCDPVPGDGGVPLGLPHDVVVFYVISRWDQRKDPATAIRAFLEAFTADDPVALVVKTTSTSQYPVSAEWGYRSPILGTTMLEVARIVRGYPNPPHIQVEIDEWPRERIAGLHTRGDCYLSLSHGEGWDVPAFDAVASGNPAVVTGWGGPLAYLDHDAFLVDFDVVQVRHFEPRSYAPSQHWAAPRVEHAAELLREIARDITAARRRVAPNRDRVLDEFAGPRVVATLAEVVPELDLKLPERSPARRARIPRIAHFAFGLKLAPEPLHLVHYLAIRSCMEMVHPDEMHLHCRHVPSGPYWDLIAPHLAVHHVERVDAVKTQPYPDPNVRRFDYAHHADFVRLDVLAEHGGLYADLDTLFVAPIPEHLWDEEFVIGREADVIEQGFQVPRPALSNAVMMSAPGSRFVEQWRAEIGGALDAVHVEPQQTFHAFEPTVAGVALLLEHPPPRLDGVIALHLAAHLWWDDERIDFSTVHAEMIDEDWIRTSPATYAVQARRFLPD